MGQNERLLKVVFGLLAALTLCLAGNVGQLVARPEPKYFAVTRDLRVLEMPPLSEPVIGNQALVNWTADVIVKSLSLNFLTWRRTLSEVRDDFDSEGYESFLAALESGGHLKKIEAERLSLSCVVSGAPVVVASGLRAGVMTWRLETPLTLSYESSAGVVATQMLLAEVEVQRTKTTKNPRGVVIRQMVLTKSG